MGGKKLFRANLLGGFNKKDVISYIDELTSRIKTDETAAREREDYAQRRIERLETELALLREAGACADSSADLVQESPDEADGQSCDADCDNPDDDAPNKESDEDILKIIDKLRENLSEVQLHNAEIKREVEQLRNETKAVYEKSRRMRDIESVVAAQKAAAVIMNDARTRSLQIKQEMDQYLVKVKKDLERFKGQLSDTRQSAVQSIGKLEEELGGLVSGIGEIDSVIGQAVSAIKTQEEN